MGHYRVIEEVALADCAFDLEGDDLNDLFATAARALAELMVDPDTLPLTVTRSVALSADTLDLLFYDWLAELIFRKDRDGEVFPRARLDVREGAPASLTAALEGGVIDPARTGLRADAKAVTFHQFRLERAAGGWRARVVIDI